MSCSRNVTFSSHSTSYTVPADYLEKGRTYTYKVRAVTSSGAVGSFSKEVTFTYNPAASLAAPTVTAGLDDQGYPALTWPAVPDAARYECDVTRSVSKMTEIERRGGKRWDKPKKAIQIACYLLQVSIIHLAKSKKQYCL